MNDYYDILGVSRDATQDEIKKAYRKKARQLHPDYAGPESEEAFKELSVAYETLSDPTKRQMYDLGGPEAARGGGAAGAGGFGGAFSDLFDMMTGFAGAAAGPTPRARRGADSLHVLDITLEEAAFGAPKEVSFSTWVTCTRCSGDCCEPGTQPVTCSTCGGVGVVQRLQQSLLGTIRTQAPCHVCQGHGTTLPSPCQECSGTGRVRSRRTLTVDVPAGVETGTRIRLSEKGEAGPGGGPNGDLYVEIRERKHPVFTRRGDDLHTWITVPMTTAALGTDFELTTLDGVETVTIKAGTQPHDEIVLHDLGVGHLHRSGRGDLHVHVDVEIPRKLDAEERDLLERLAAVRGEERVEPKRVEQSVFDRIREKFTGA